MPLNHDKVVEAAMRLRAGDTVGWDQFVAAVYDHASQMLNETLRAPPDMLQRAQGMAIEAGEFASLLANAAKMHENRQLAMMGTKNGRREQQWKV
jgi:hypothetical protein